MHRGLVLCCLLVACLAQAARAQESALTAASTGGRRPLDAGTPPNYCGGPPTQYQSCLAHRVLQGNPISTSNSYCLVSIASDCKFVDGSGAKNVDCEPCYLWSKAQAACSSSNPPATCKKGFIMGADDCSKNVWKVWPTKKPFRGIEDMAGGKSPSAMNYLWSNLWASGLPGGANPCSSTAGYKPLRLDGAPFGAMLINAFGYRTQHTWHAHLGIAHDQLRIAVKNFIVPKVTKAKTWTDAVPYTWQTTAHGAVDSSLWAYLLGPVNPKSYEKATPNNVASLIAAAHKTGPLKALTPEQRNFTGAAVTGAEWGGKQYFAVVIYNYAAAWAANHGKQIGEYELIYHG